MSTNIEYFDRFYNDNHDPWGYHSHWYEERKRQLCLALLIQPRYKFALELGCANGCFSKVLASRVESLICIDAHPKAVALAKAELKHLKHVNVQEFLLPRDFPKENFDLIVLSEVAYYLTDEELRELALKMQNQLTEQGVILSCHWRHPVEGFDLNGEMVHQILKQEFKLHHYTSVQDPDFLIDVWTQNTKSLAQLEGII